MIVIVSVTALLIASVVGVVLRNGRQSMPLSEVSVVASSSEVRVKAVERNSAANVATAATAAFLNKATSLMGELWYYIRR